MTQTHPPRFPLPWWWQIVIVSLSLAVFVAASTLHSA